MLEFLDAGSHGGASGPDIVEENIGYIGVDGNSRIDHVRIGRLIDTSETAAADLNGVFGTV